MRVCMKGLRKLKKKLWGINMMDLSAYLFATYVFILLCVTIWLFGRVLKKSKKAREIEKTGFEKEKKLFTLYQNVEDMLASFEEYVEETQSETDKTITEMQKILQEVKRLAASLQVGSAAIEAAEPVAVAETHDESTVQRTESLHLVAPMPLKISDEARKPASPPKLSRTGSKVLELRANGLEQNEIAKQLGISVREVSLAMKIAGAGEDK